MPRVRERKSGYAVDLLMGDFSHQVVVRELVVTQLTIRIYGYICTDFSMQEYPFEDTSFSATIDLYRSRERKRVYRYLGNSCLCEAD